MPTMKTPAENAARLFTSTQIAIATALHSAAATSAQRSP